MKRPVPSRVVVTTKEHSFVPLDETGRGISRAHLTELQEIQNSGNEALFKMEVRGGQVGLKFQQFAGVVNFRDGSSLEILAKPPGSSLNDPQARDLIVHMVRIASKAPARTGRLGTAKQGETLQDNYISAVLDEAAFQVSEGFHRQFSIETEEGHSLRGKLMLQHQLSRYPGRHDRFVQSYPVWSYDTDINRLLLSAVKSMLSATRSRRLRRELLKLVTVFGELGVGPLKAIPPNREFHRADSRWLTSYSLCLQWLRRALPSLRADGRRVGPSMLFDMNDVFERYVRQSLKRVAPTLVQSSAKPTKMFRDSHGRGLLKLIPDVEVGRRGAAGPPLPLVCDAKWKEPRAAGGWKLEPADLRQMYAYAKILRFSRAALIFPTMAEVPKVATFYSQDPDPIELTVLELPLGTARSAERDTILATLIDPSGIEISIRHGKTMQQPLTIPV